MKIPKSIDILGITFCKNFDDELNNIHTFVYTHLFLFYVNLFFFLLRESLNKKRNFTGYFVTLVCSFFSHIILFIVDSLPHIFVDIRVCRCLHFFTHFSFLLP